MTNEEYYNMSLEERCSFALKGMKHIEFYKKDGVWYADVPEHSEEENEMVAGADVFLDKISDGCSSVGLDVFDKIYPKARILLKRTDHDDYGATYIILDNHRDAPALSGESQVFAGHKLWLCNVTHTFLGEHPEYISII